MARASTKFCGPSSKLLLLIVPAFIMLSEAVVTEKTGSCYWCGPLAEQVHRSRRAPPCDAAGNHVTTCDPDLPHCAIVATSPPYVESRLCVKIYQDECYPLFCNSTKTWKMTCPCRGDLCNGPNSLREEEAFAILEKLVTKTRTTRIKKRTQQKVAKFFPIDQKTTIITNVSEVENNEINDNLLNITTKDDITQIMLSDAPINSDEENEKISESTEILSTADVIQETTEKIEVSRINYVMTSADTNDDILKGLEVLTHKLVNNPVKPSEELPTAEALQQNSSPKTSEKTVVTTSTTTLETTMDTTTEASIQTTSLDSESKNNGEDTLYKAYLLLHLAAFSLHYVSSYYVM